MPVRVATRVCVRLCGPRLKPARQLTATDGDLAVPRSTLIEHVTLLNGTLSVASRGELRVRLRTSALRRPMLAGACGDGGALRVRSSTLQLSACFWAVRSSSS